MPAKGGSAMLKIDDYGRGIYTTIRVKVGTKDRLVKLGAMGDTYDVVIQRLLDKVDKKAVK